MVCPRVIGKILPQIVRKIQHTLHPLSSAYSSDYAATRQSCNYPFTLGEYTSSRKPRHRHATQTAGTQKTRRRNACSSACGENVGGQRLGGSRQPRVESLPHCPRRRLQRPRLADKLFANGLPCYQRLREGA